MEMCVCVPGWACAHVRVCGETILWIVDSPPWCQPINEVCKPSSLKKHGVGHTHFHKHSHTRAHCQHQTWTSLISGTNIGSEKLSCLPTAYILDDTKCLLLCVCVCVRGCPFLCPCVCVPLSLFGQAIKDWFRVVALKQLPSAASLTLCVERTKAFRGPHLLSIPPSPSVCLPLPTALFFLAVVLVLHSSILIRLLRLSDSALLFSNVGWVQHKHGPFICFTVW